MKIFKGKVVSTKMRNTATVLVDSTFKHRLYGKRFTRSKKYHVHDEYGSKVGETVNFVASKPYSRIKKWRIVKIVSKKKTAKKNQKDTLVAEKKTKRSK